MRDYYTVIARAVSQLESDTPAARSAIFDRARAVLINHLRMRRPPPPDSEISNELATLEEAIQRIELEIATSRTTAAQAGSLRRTTRTRDFQKRARGAGIPPPPRPQDLTRNGYRAKAGDKAELSPPAITVGPRLVHLLRTLLGQMTLTRRRITRRQAVPVEPRKGPASNKGGDRGRPPAPVRDGDIAPTLHWRKAVKNGRTTLSGTDHPARELADNINFSTLLGIQLLDELMREAALTTAPDSLKDDLRSVLDWLGLDETKEIKIQHYDQFTRALQTYIIESQDTSGDLVRTASGGVLALTDTIRGAFSRLIEREQTWIVFNKTLMWFAGIWVKAFVILNVIAVIVLLASAPTLWLGGARLFDAFANPSNWIGELVAVLPALIAKIWLQWRLKTPRMTAGLGNSIVRADFGTVLADP